MGYKKQLHMILHSWQSAETTSICRTVITEVRDDFCLVYVTLPGSWKEGLFWAAGLLKVEGGTTLPFLGEAADLEKVFAAGEGCTAAGVVLSTASLGNKYILSINHNSLQHQETHIFSHTYITEYTVLV